MFDNPPDWATKKADIAIDLGTANTLVVDRSAEVIFEEPSICCFDDDIRAPRRIFAAGNEAKRVVGRETKQLRSVRPLRNGVLVDVKATCELLKFAVAPARRRSHIRRMRPVIGVPTDATQAERRALTKAAYDAGLAEPVLMAEPMLAAIGLGVDVDAPRGRMIVDCGAGITDVVVISLGGICVRRSVRGGGDAIDAALIQHLHLKRHFHIGATSAETLKLAISTAMRTPGAQTLEIRGLDMLTGLPRVLALDLSELRPIIEKHAGEVAAAVRSALAVTDPDLAMDILEDGITLTGGAAHMPLVAEQIRELSGTPVKIDEAPARAVARGLATIIR